MLFLPNVLRASSLVVLFLLLIGTTSVLARVVSSSSAFLHRSLETRIGLFCNGNPIGYVDPTGRIATKFAQDTGLKDAYYSVGDTAINAVPGGLSLLSWGMGAAMKAAGMPYGHLYQQAGAIDERLSPYARAGFYDQNSVVATAVAAGSVIIAPGSVSTKLASRGVKPLFGVPTSAIVKNASIAPYLPANSGFIGQTKRQFLMPGQVIDRYGGTGYSRFFSPVGTPEVARSLPGGAAGQSLRTFEVMKPFEVNMGTIAPAFGQLGFGQQMVTPVKLEILLKRGILKETTLP